MLHYSPLRKLQPRKPDSNHSTDGKRHQNNTFIIIVIINIPYEISSIEKMEVCFACSKANRIKNGKKGGEAYGQGHRLYV